MPAGEALHLVHRVGFHRQVLLGSGRLQRAGRGHPDGREPPAEAGVQHVEADVPARRIAEKLPLNREGPGGGAGGAAARFCYAVLQLRLFTVAGVEPDPMNPNVVESPAATVPFQLAFLTVTSEPLVLAVPLQSWVRVCELGQVQVTVHLPMAEVPACTITWPWNPPVHAPVTLYMAVQPPAGAEVGPVVGGVVGEVVGGVVGLVVGGVVGLVVGGVVVPVPTPVTSPLPPSKITSEQP